MKTTACSLMWTTINTEEYNMNILEKTLKTYGKEGKRKYQQIKINKRDNLQDGTVYVLTEEQYEEIAIYEKQLKEYKKSVLTANEENSQLKGQLETVTQAYDSQIQQLQKQMELLKEDKIKYKILYESQQEQLMKLGERIETLTEKLETSINETGRATAQLEDLQLQLQAVIKKMNEKDTIIQQLQTTIHEQEKNKLSELYMIHSRLTSLSLFDFLRGRHKPIVEDIEPTSTLEEIETVANRQNNTH